MSEHPEYLQEICGFTPRDADVHDLIRKAEAHKLGTDFLKTGALDSVAAMFEVHAFVVEAARKKLDGVGTRQTEVRTIKAGAGVRA